MQYNVHNSNSVMTSLLQNSKTKTTDVIAMQKLYKQTQVHATHCLETSRFILYYLNFETDACFLINRRLALSQYTVEYSRERVIIMTIITRDHKLNIINVYFRSSESKRDSMSNSSIHELSTLLDRSEEIVLVSDFNVHNSLWEEEKVIRDFTHSLSHTLLNHLSAFDMRINNRQETITYERFEESSFIDLIATTRNIHEKINEWKIWEEVNADSDHKLIKIELNIEISTEDVKYSRKWNMMNMKEVRASSEHLWTSNSLNSHQEIDAYAEYLKAFIKQLIENTVSLRKTFSDSLKSNFWWTSEIQETITEV